MDVSPRRHTGSLTLLHSLRQGKPPRGGSRKNCWASYRMRHTFGCVQMCRLAPISVEVWTLTWLVLLTGMALVTHLGHTMLFLMTCSLLMVRTRRCTAICVTA